MRRWIIVVGITLCVVTDDAALAQEGGVVTCSGILIEVDMIPGADFPMAVISDNADDGLARHTCVLDLGHAERWPLKGACWIGEKCVLRGPYFKRIANTYYMRTWDKAEAPGHPPL